MAESKSIASQTVHIVVVDGCSGAGKSHICEIANEEADSDKGLLIELDKVTQPLIEKWEKMLVTERSKEVCKHMFFEDVLVPVWNTIVMRVLRDGMRLAVIEGFNAIFHTAFRQDSIEKGELLDAFYSDFRRSALENCLPEFKVQWHFYFLCPTDEEKKLCKLDPDENIEKETTIRHAVRDHFAKTVQFQTCSQAELLAKLRAHYKALE